MHCADPGALVLRGQISRPGSRQPPTPREVSRLHAARDAGVQGSFLQEAFPRALDEIGREKGVEPAAIEVWFADEARIGQKNKITRRWAKRSTRPSAPTDQRTASAYIFWRDLPPGDGKGAALVAALMRKATEAMSLHLAETATQIAPSAHAAPLVDQAGWHLSGGLIIAAQHHPDRATCEMPQN